MHDFPSRWSEVRQRILHVIDEFGSCGNYILGAQLKQFEKDLAVYWGLDYAVGCASGLDALEIAIRCSEVESGSLILTTPLSAFATTLAIVRAGCVPVFVDTDEMGLVDLDLARQAIEKRDIRNFIPVHLFGNPMDLSGLQKLKEDFELNVIEDCAQSIGANFDGRVTGSVGAFACTSFYPTKNLGCLGDGGAVLTNREALADLAKSFRNYGETSKYTHTYLGMNSRLDEIQAAVLSEVFLPQLQRELIARNRVAQFYLKNISHPLLRLPKLHPKANSAWHLFPIFVSQRRADFVAHLLRLGVSSAVHYPTLIPFQEALTQAGEVQISGELTVAKQLVESEVSLPIHAYLRQEDYERVVAACNSWES